MGYDTQYRIKITATDNARRVMIAKQIAMAASGLDTLFVAENKKHVLKMFAKEIKSVKQGEDMCFERRHWDPVRDFRGSWYDSEREFTREGIHLADGEMLEFECAGEEDTDRWKAQVTACSFTVTTAHSVEYINKLPVCPTDEEDEGFDPIDPDAHTEVCTGCGACATIVPIYS